MNTPLKTQRLYITQFTEKMADSVCLNSLDDDNRRFIPDEVFETVDAAHMAISTIRTDRLLIRPFKPDDWRVAPSSFQNILINATRPKMVIHHAYRLHE